MRLRAFTKEDAAVVCSWLRTEEEMYRWSADRFNKFPLQTEDVMENYAPQIASGRFFPLAAVDEEDRLVGHFIIRYPREDDDSSVRFGFVIVDPAMRGKGHGKAMLLLGIRYVQENLCSQTTIVPDIAMRRPVSGLLAIAYVRCRSGPGTASTWNCS